MKKLLVLVLALFLVVAFTLPATAVENKLGGYFRTRFMAYYNDNGLDDGTGDDRLIDTRTRLYWTSILNENLKFVFKSEHDATWGGAAKSGAFNGQLTADGEDFQVKSAYVDFNIDKFRFIVGTQGFEWGRSGFLFSDDATGVALTYRGMEKTVIPALYWLRYNEGGSGNNNGKDADLYTALVNIMSGDMQIVPYVTYWYANDGAGANPVATDTFAANTAGTAGQQLKVYYAGLDFNMKLDPVSFMLTGIYQGGDFDDTIDVSAYLLDGAFKVKVANFGVHGEALYATGDDNTDNTIDAFAPPPGASYTWSEGYAKGDIDKHAFASSLAGGPFGSKEISDLMAFNLGLDFNITKTWGGSFDFWNINLAEDDAFGNSDIGNEISLKLKGKVIDNLDLLLVGAYMFAGDSFNGGVADEGDPIELAAQLSISF